jgi:hypothetical protein
MYGRVMCWRGELNLQLHVSCATVLGWNRKPRGGSGSSSMQCCRTHTGTELVVV